MYRRSYPRQSSRPSGHRISTAHPLRCTAHASTETRRQDMSEWITSAVLSFGSCRALSISSPEGTRPSIGTVPTGGGYPPNTPCPSAIGRTITCSNHGSEQERQLRYTNEQPTTTA